MCATLELDDWDMPPPVKTPRIKRPKLNLSRITICRARPQPVFDECGNQNCTWSPPCWSPDCQYCEDRRTHRGAKRIARRMIGRPCLFLTLTASHATDDPSEQREHLIG